MARSQTNGALIFVKWAGAAAAAIVGGIAIGYLIGYERVAHPPSQPALSPVTIPLAPASSVNPAAIHPRTANGNYTAPGAPRIVIQEESQAVLRRVEPKPAPTPDPEATQEASPAPAPPQAAPPASDSAAATPPGNLANPAPPPSTAAATGGSSVPAAAPPAAPADPDFERVNPPLKPSPNTNAPNPNAPDSESGQQSGTQQSGQSLPDPGKVQFRVQTGSYTDESNARSVADQLRGQGYATSTRSEKQGNHLVYKVQVGAYHSKVGAGKAADDLQKKGFPAFVSPINP